MRDVRDILLSENMLVLVMMQGHPVMKCGRHCRSSMKRGVDGTGHNMVFNR